MDKMIHTELLTIFKNDIKTELLDEYNCEEINMSKEEYEVYIDSNIDNELLHIDFNFNIPNQYVSRRLFDINDNNCKARIWNNHISSQCSHKSKYGDYCGKHNNMIKKHGQLRFNRIDEELPLNDNYTQKHLDWF